MNYRVTFDCYINEAFYRRCDIIDISEATYQAHKNHLRPIEPSPEPFSTKEVENPQPTITDTATLTTEELATIGEPVKKRKSPYDPPHEGMPSYKALKAQVAALGIEPRQRCPYNELYNTFIMAQQTPTAPTETPNE